MRSVVFGTVIVIGLLVAGLFTSSPRPSVALSATPDASPGSGTPIAMPGELCSAEELALGENVDRLPPGPPAGVVRPEGTGRRVLYLTVMTLPPNACIGYRERSGGVVLFVQEGTIVYTARFGEDTIVLKGDSDGYDCTTIRPGCDTIAVASDASVTVDANEWVSQENHAWYTFRNAGDEDAVVSVASWVLPYWGDDGCNSGCRTP